MLRPASPGTGVIAGGAARAVLECAGVHDILAKSLGVTTRSTWCMPPFPLKLLQRPEEVAARRGLPIEDVAPPSMLRARREAEAAAASAAPPHVKDRHSHGRAEDHPGTQHHRCAVEAEGKPAVVGTAEDPPVGRPQGDEQTRGLIKSVHHLVEVEEV